MCASPVMWWCLMAKRIPASFWRVKCNLIRSSNCIPVSIYSSSHFSPFSSTLNKRGMQSFGFKFQINWTQQNDNNYVHMFGMPFRIQKHDGSVETNTKMIENHFLYQIINNNLNHFRFINRHHHHFQCEQILFILTNDPESNILAPKHFTWLTWVQKDNFHFPNNWQLLLYLSQSGSCRTNNYANMNKLSLWT